MNFRILIALEGNAYTEIKHLPFVSNSVLIKYDFAYSKC